MSQTKAQLIDPVDGTIVNADINASAAIAGSKISPDFGSQNIVTTGTLGSGNLTVTSASPEINLVDSGDNPDYLIYRCHRRASDWQGFPGIPAVYLSAGSVLRGGCGDPRTASVQTDH